MRTTTMVHPFLFDIDGTAALEHPATARPQAAPAPLRRSVPSAPRGLDVQLRGVGKRYGERTVLHDIDLDIRPGEFVAIVGRSGCGKSTLLRLLAQLEQPSSGQIADAQGAALSTHQAEIRIMFQDARLLPWKRVIDNIALGLTGPDRRERALEALAQVGLADRANEWPAVLSGGQRQRVALARALVHAPRLLLLDEPLGALDALTRIEMHRLIESLWQRHGFTALLVTHDVAEAVALADRVLLIEDQRVTLDQRITLPRPRQHGEPAFARHESQILQRVLQQPAAEPEAPIDQQRWRFAV
ncbi:ATP-binding cassette domain-containing protein [Aquincola tertiaricarbonis]|uniref:ATP-binding cassette domain-containing protein n=1 Tax=Aquincola tertiaricarbonis TaxID=391953 RepID=A0ABY4S4R8_AQUTE|nr:ATP-binding cassette domain-containing protein [Aquincola tertiaricarbonis]URI06111.1 ATP-binding cassette domain-containing protein [Aquincola tertiaricarbonis]